MKKMRAGWVCFLVVLGVMVSRGWGHTDVSPTVAAGMIVSDPNLIVVDVREYESEYCSAGHIAGALNYPWFSGVLQARYGELPLAGDILVVCRSGGRSNMAATFLDSKDFEHVYDMEDGMSAWGGATVGCVDGDGDGVNDDLDNCPELQNAGQADGDGDRTGNLCDCDWFNADGLGPVDVADWATVTSHWQQAGADTPGDFNGDEIVDVVDLSIFAFHWMSDCEGE